MGRRIIKKSNIAKGVAVTRMFILLEMITGKRLGVLVVKIHQLGKSQKDEST